MDTTDFAEDKLSGIAGNLIMFKNVLISKFEGGLEVSWEWSPYFGERTINWSFRNSSYKTKNFILFRNGYYFGSAYWPIQVNNPVYHVELATSLEPYVDEGPWLNAPRLGIVEHPSGRFIICYIFTLAPVSTWRIIEGGFDQASPPSGIHVCEVKFVRTGEFCIEYDPRHEVIRDLQIEKLPFIAKPYAPNPKTFKSVLVSAPEGSPSPEFDFEDEVTEGACK